MHIDQFLATYSLRPFVLSDMDQLRVSELGKAANESDEASVPLAYPCRS